MNANQPVNTLNQVNECPICMDAIDGLCNRVVTECGHAFHCSCLMKNAAHNGFGCPYCRTTMAETPAVEEDDEYDEDDEEESILDDDVLTSFRMFHQRINGEEVEEEPAEEWESVDEDEDEDEDEEEEEGARPDAAYVAQKLVERGITFEDLVKNIMFQEHSGWGQHYIDYERRSSEVYGQFRAAFSQFRPNQPAPIPTPTPTPVASSDSAIPPAADPTPVIHVPEVAEAKSVSVFHRREFMIHV